MPKEEQAKVIEDIASIVKVDNFSYEKFVNNYAVTMGRTFERLLRSATAYNNPLYANDVLKDVNLTPNRPTTANLRRWLNRPRDYEKELRDASQFLQGVINQYFRSIGHFATLLSLNYDLIPINRIPKEKKKKVTYYNCKERANEWLRKFRPREQFNRVMWGVMGEGGKYYYLRESDDFIALQEMPQDFCYITDQTSVGWAYQFDMTFFYRYPDAFTLHAPEFEYWYQAIAKEIEKAPHISIYLPMPIEKAAVFKFDDWNAAIRPPLSGTFKDALEIQDYKDLLKTRIELDTWQIIMQEIPKDKDGKPTISPELAGVFVALVQSQLPNGVRTAATPLKPEAITFNQSQTQNNIIGTGEENFWSSVGIAGNQFGRSDKSGLSLKYSNLADYNFVKHIYTQFDRFINFQLSRIKGEYKFAVKFHGCSIFEEDEIKTAINMAQNGGSKQRLFTTSGYEPWQIENMLHDEIDSGINDLLIPIKTSHTISKESSGAPPKNETEMTDKGLNTKGGDYNNA